jgi:hypothetical protein
MFYLTRTSFTLLQSHKERLMQWIPLSLALFVTGLAIHYGGWEMNKQLWSPSYLFFMAGCTGILLTIFYLMMDFTSWQPVWLNKPYKITNMVWWGLGVIVTHSSQISRHSPSLLFLLYGSYNFASRFTFIIVDSVYFHIK